MAESASSSSISSSSSIAATLAEKVQNISLKESKPCIVVLGMAGSGKSSFVQV